MKRTVKCNLLNRYGLCFFPLFFLSYLSIGQVYPSYVANVFDSAASVGYYFMSPKYSKSINNPPGGFMETQMILDRYGELIYFHNFIGTRASDFKIQPNGIMTFIDKDEGFYMDSTFTYTDSVWVKNGILYDQHDLQILPNGNFLLIGAEKVTMDLSSYNMFNNNNTPGSKNAIVRCGVIQEQDANKNVVFEWHSKDYYDFEDTDESFLIDTAKVDWTHFNAVDLDSDGNILLSTRRMNEITKINRSNGSIMWRLGGKQNQFTFVNDTPQFKAQHDIRKLSNGNITLFDNGYRSPFQPCRAVEYMLDEVQLTATKVWSYTYDSTKMSEWLGNVQRTSNGNTLINYGNLDSSNLVFNLVNPAGVPIFEVRTLDTLNSYRSFNYPVLPWNINPPKINCDLNGGQVFLSVDSGFSKYYWSTGDTTFKITITNPGTYYVFVPRGSGGFLRSEKFIVTDMVNPCPVCPKPNQPTLISGGLTPCLTTSQLYSVSLDTSATSYTWTLPSGWSGSSVNNTITTTVGALSGVISVKANNSCGSSPVRSMAVTVSQIPAIPINIIGNSNPCPATSYTYSVTPVSGASNYIWTLPSGWSGSSTTNSINVLTGSKGGAVSALGINACGQGLKRFKTVSMTTAAAKPTVIFGSQFGVCESDSVSYQVALVPGLTYIWSFDNSNAAVTSGQGSETVYASFTPAFVSDSLRVTTANSCGTSPQRSLFIKSIPQTPASITGAATVCQNQSGVPYSIVALPGASTYTWKGPTGARFSDGITTSTTATFTTASPAVTVNFKTTAGFIKVNGNNTCGSGAVKSMAVSFNCRESAFPYPGSLYLAASPNPFHGKLTVSFGLNKYIAYELKLLDLTGRFLFVWKGTGINGHNERQLDLSYLSKGSYLLQLQTQSGSKIIRLVVD